MTGKTQRLLEMGNETLDNLGVSRKALTPTTMTTDSVATGDFMDRTQVERLVDLTVGQSGWLSTVTTKVRSQKKGEIPRMEISDVVTEGVAENGGSTVSTHPDFDNISYECGKFQATWFLTIEDIREARASGEANFDAKVRRAFAKAMGNDMARWCLRGDTDLDASSRLNRLLRKKDGWIKQARADANRATTTYGSAFQRSLFPALKASLPQQFRDDPDLRWFMPGDIDEEWTDILAGYSGGSGAAIGDTAINQRRRFMPYGIPPLIIPQMPTDQGFSTLTASAVDADAVTDNGDDTIKLQVDTLFGGYSSSNAGRKVKVTYDATGQSETLTVTDSGSQNDIDTTGTLGQSTISTTASDYTLDVADCTPVMLTNPRNLFVVMCDQIRAYRKFEQEYERWRIDVYYEADAGIFNPNALAMQDGVIVPTQSFGS